MCQLHRQPAGRFAPIPDVPEQTYGAGEQTFGGILDTAIVGHGLAPRERL